MREKRFHLFLNRLRLLYSIPKSFALLLAFHCARHTFATTLCLSQGIPLSTVSKMLGHKQITTTQIYAQTTPIMIEDAIDRVESRLGGKFAV
ncbi:tyrosine-type recombinase/integrase [uncultured Alistipes sp.]|uniref:tyrosine-type recombinase/integrase n=1 Tax=uncultured Alistipes sp. TaxID=538949 RepID=UPI00259245B9|nr:tyrosine-type recombinase/integrase [uncultured Alistipes sp.]